MLLAVLSGCASLAVDRATTWPQQPASRELRDVPFFPQQEYYCGPAALATVLQASGVSRTPESLAGNLLVPDRRGTLQPELVATARSQGRLVYRVGPRLEELFAQVAEGKPVLVLQNLGLSWVPRWHYAVLVGYDAARQEVVLRSGGIQRHVMSARTFERTWSRAGGWGIVVLEPGELPARPDRVRFLKAVGDLEQGGFVRAAAEAYSAATTAWPDSELPWIGLGNALYAQGRQLLAVDAFASAVTVNPESADALNNYAHVLNELGRREEALRAARRAVAIGGESRPEFAQTLAVIEAGARRDGGAEKAPPQDSVHRP